MRFFIDGPNIPDELLLARDEGRVIFFCGAGVSVERAKLPSFLELIHKVIKILRVSPDSSIYKVLNEIENINKNIDETGLISVDRIFGMLEREFLSKEIEAAVAKTLKPKKGTDLSAHKILVDLATTPENKIRLVTTNFDRLFESCCKQKNIWSHPRLPDPSRPNDMDGIIHLHGYVNDTYTAAKGDGFILTSSEFGRAYLAEGWATKFFKEILEQYVVVFVGYTADDPPVHYLLEALNKSADNLDGIYTFHPGNDNKSMAKWLHKGVEAIPYDDTDGHKILWTSLEAWSKRAKNPDKWYESVIENALKGPRKLNPHERGQVAHIVGSLFGARKFSNHEPPPPAEWVRVFDRKERYSNVIQDLDSSGVKSFIDPFTYYSLDTDTAPKKFDKDNLYAQREIPRESWDGLSANQSDLKNIEEIDIASIKGPSSKRVPNLTSRLYELGLWFLKVVEQPDALWWAAGQNSLHPDIQDRIWRNINNKDNDVPAELTKAWMYLFDYYDSEGLDHRRDRYDLQLTINNTGWDWTLLKRVYSIQKPYIEVKRCRWDGGALPSDNTFEVSAVVNLDVEYPDPITEIIIPDEWLSLALKEHRKNLEHAQKLMSEIGNDFGFRLMCPISQDENSDDDSYERSHGITGQVVAFSEKFKRLVTLNIKEAKVEFNSWQNDDNTVFSRLRVWASGIKELLSGKELKSFLIGLNDDVFWDYYHRTDLLSLIANRWSSLSKTSKSIISRRILNGRTKWDGESKEEYIEGKAWETLDRLHWLAKKGCDFNFNLEVKTKKLQKLAPDWTLKSINAISDVHGAQGGWVETKTEHDDLHNVHIGDVLSKAKELSGKSDFLTREDPFLGYCADHPVKAYLALVDAAKNNKHEEWAWRTFLNHDARKNDKLRLSVCIAERILRFDENTFSELFNHICNWLLSSVEKLTLSCANVYDKLLKKVLKALHENPDLGKSHIVRGIKEPDWASEALNSSVGKLTQAIFKDARIDDLENGKGLPSAWLSHIHELLKLKDDKKRSALVFLAHNTNWFYWKDPDWTEANLLSILHQDDAQDLNAFWSGFFWGVRRLPAPNLFLSLKPDLMSIARNNSYHRKGNTEVLAALILMGWLHIDKNSEDRLVSDHELHGILLSSDDEFRTQLIWTLKNHINHVDNKSDEKLADEAINLLENVWPRQKAIRTPVVSARLCDLAFSNLELFPRLFNSIKPLLIKVSNEHLHLPFFRGNKKEIVDVYPRETLELLYLVLPDDAKLWSYGVEEIIHSVGEADNALRKTVKFRTLNRRWDSR